MPKTMTLEDIEAFKAKWVAAVQRALAAGFDVSPDRVPPISSSPQGCKPDLSPPRPADQSTNTARLCSKGDRVPRRPRLPHQLVPLARLE